MMLSDLKKKSQSLGMYITFAILIVVFAIGFGAVSPSQSCGGGPGTFSNDVLGKVDGVEIDAALVRTAGNLSDDGPSATNPSPTSQYIMRFSQMGLISPWSGSRFSPDADQIPLLKFTKMTDDLVEQKVLANWGHSLELATHPKELQDGLSLLLRNFIDPDDNEFQESYYRSFVRSINTDINGFENFASDEILRERLIQLLVGEVAATEAEIELEHRLANEKVKINTIIVNDDTATPLVQVSEEDVAAYLEKNEEELKAEYEAKKAIEYTSPKTLVIRAIKINAPDSSLAADDDQREALEAERQTAKAQAEAVLQSLQAALKAVPEGQDDDGQDEASKRIEIFAEFAAKESHDAASKDKGGSFGEKTLDELGRYPFNPSIREAADTLQALEASKIVDSPNGFWILFAENVKEETTTPFDDVKSAMAKLRVQGEKVSEFKKTLADKIFETAKKDPKGSFSELAEKILAEYGASEGIEAGTATFSRLTDRAGYLPQGSPYIAELRSKAPELVSKAFQASEDSPLLPKVFDLDDGRIYVIAQWAEHIEADAIEDEQREELRNSINWENRHELYRAWYDSWLAEKKAKGSVKFTKAYTSRQTEEANNWIQAGGALPGTN